MLINICAYDICCQTTLLQWTILGTENEQLTLLLLFHEIGTSTLHVETTFFQYVRFYVTVGGCSKN